MLNRFVANWLREAAQEAVLQGFQTPEKGQQQLAEQADSSVDSPIVDIALFFPAARQAVGLVDLLQNVQVSECHGFVERIGRVADRRVAVLEADLPHERLALVVRDVIRLRQPKWVLSTGFAVGLGPGVSRGHLLVANRLVDAQGYSLSIDAKISPGKGMHVGPLLTLSQEISAGTGDDEASMPEETSALACDRQAAVVGEVCRVLKTKMIAIHAILGDARQADSKLTKEITTQGTLAGMLGAAAGALLEKPSSFKDFWNDGEARLVVSDRLAKFLIAVMRQLPK